MALYGSILYAVLGVLSVTRTAIALATKHIHHPTSHAQSSKNESLPPLNSDRKLSHFIVVPEHKLLFCYINKVGCTSFNDMFRRLRSRYDPSQGSGSVWNRNTPEIHNVSEEQLRDMLVDSSWHKAVFFREPIERFVSAYRSKCEGADKRFGHAHCRKMFGEDFVTFDAAVEHMQQLDGMDDTHMNDIDPHFWMQKDFCGGLGDTLKYYDTVEQLERSTSHTKVSKLLEQIGVDAKTIPKFDEIFPREGEDDWQDKSHNTDSGGELLSYFPKDKSSLPEGLLHYYQQDYALFDIKVPTWLPNAIADIAQNFSS